MELKKQSGFAAHGFDHLEIERKRIAAQDRVPQTKIMTAYGPKKLVRIGTRQLTTQQERLAEARRDQRDGITKEETDGQLSGDT